ncbi:MAG: hypothetical protein NTZ05_15585, partial [Chloroflexi bacterium]|nr:hypothetical protein [Chloroflexota bacterium]
TRDRHDAKVVPALLRGDLETAEYHVGQVLKAKAMIEALVEYDQRAAAAVSEYRAWSDEVKSAEMPAA